MISREEKRSRFWISRHQAEAEDQRVKHQQREGADKAEFLGKRGEDEVGVLFGQEVQPDCVPCMKPLPDQPPDPSAILAWMML
jgi:hypothetical protein